MNRLIPTLALSTLLLACAHDAKHEQSAAHARAAGDERASNNEVQNHKVDAEHDKARAEERVELKHRGDPDRVASHGEAIPQRDADNTEVNSRDRDGENVTPFDQGNGEIDLKLTQLIRKGVMDDDSLSFGSKNVKIITRGGHVTLRGAVDNAAEKEAINKIALTHAGIGHVSNELEIED